MAVNAADEHGDRLHRARQQRRLRPHQRRQRALLRRATRASSCSSTRPRASAHGQFIEYQVNVVDDSVPLEVALCWTDYSGQPGARRSSSSTTSTSRSRTASHDLQGQRLRRRSSRRTGGIYDDLQRRGGGAGHRARDRDLDDPRSRRRRCRSARSRSALCITGGVGNDAGALALDRAEYGSTSTVELQVTDTNAGAIVNVDADLDHRAAPARRHAQRRATASTPARSRSPPARPDRRRHAVGLERRRDHRDLPGRLAGRHADRARRPSSFATPIITNVHALPQGAARARW